MFCFCAQLLSGDSPDKTVYVMFFPLSCKRLVGCLGNDNRISLPAKSFDRFPGIGEWWRVPQPGGNVFVRRKGPFQDGSGGRMGIVPDVFLKGGVSELCLFPDPFPERVHIREF